MQLYTHFAEWGELKNANDDAFETGGHTEGSWRGKEGNLQTTN